ncbi:MAG TPA: hypothetical protein VKZ79_01470 [Alphaproteobacteria bacterium]|nr:hypothetical protein [Alphaproteobacteria bacterium]
MRNIVNQARAERNDAVALAQDRRMLLDQAADLLRRSRDLAKAADPTLALEIGGFLGSLDDA